jgi:hypothetical protein
LRVYLAAAPSAANADQLKAKLQRLESLAAAKQQ